MSGSQQLLLGGAPTVTPVDPYFYSVTSLLHGDGTNGGQNNTFLDSSSNNFTITRNGNTTQGSFSPFSQTGWSNYFDGTGDYLTAPSNAAFQFGTGDFTIECWSYVTGGDNQLFYDFRSSFVSNNGFNFGRSNADGFYVYNNVEGVIIGSGAGTAATNTYVHVAVSRSGSTLRLFINGILVKTATNSTNYNSTAVPTIGGSSTTLGTPGNLYTGYISNLRVVKGTAVYTADFTVPTTPLTAISGTSLLTCQANRFLDASSNAFAITRAGDVSVQPFSPFNPTTAYSTSAVGGSGYFDGSGDALYAPANAAFNFGAPSGNTNDFTVEMWVYPLNFSNIYFLYGTGPSGGADQFYLNTDGRAYYFDGASQVSSPVLTANSWNHLALVRNGSGSNNIRVYGNGVSGTAVTSSTSLGSSVNSPYIGMRSDGSYPLPGYISSLRIVKGTAVYTAAFTPPTAPLTAITNTSLLLNFTNGAIFDNAAVADYETVGNAQISTSVKKYGTGSMYFDGTGDWLIAPSTINCNFGTGDFTVEMWVYPTSVGGGTERFLFDTRATGTDSGLAIYLSTTGVLSVNSSNAVIATGGVVTANVWSFISVTRVAGVLLASINGTSGARATYTSSITAPGSVRVGVKTDGTTPYIGYIDDLRISKGVGRYPYNFTPPTAEFPNIGGTVTLTADPYFDYTTLLLPGNGTNGAQNNTFLDSSSNAFSITRNGNTTQGTFSPFSQTGWGNFFDGSGDYLTAPSNAAFDFGTGDFTLEAWGYRTSSGAYGFLISRRAADVNYGPFSMGLDGSNAPYFACSSSGSSWIFVLTGSALPLNSWFHLAGVRNGNTFALYVNGTSVGTATSSASLMASSVAACIGAHANGSEPFAGYISNARIVKGTAVYTSNFTPPTSPLTAITNTSLLTCQSNRFIDNSSNAFAITRNGDVSVQAFSPFNPTAAWSAATNGGSGYFDGSGDYLTFAPGAAFAFGTGDFTVEAWAYVSSTGGKYIIDARNSGQTGAWAFGIDLNAGGNNRLAWYTGSTTIEPTTELVTNAWNHCVYVRSGTTYALFLNGTRIGTGTDSTNYSVSPTTSYVGSFYNLAAYFNGYLANVRTVKGTAVYSPSSTTLTVPTAPLTAITNTSFLLNFTNGAIYDATSKNDLETVGNAQISTTQSKFGGSSIYLDGTGDWLSMPNNQNFVFGTGDFTIEFWYYGNDTAGGFGQLSGGTTGYWQLLLFSSSMYWQSVRDTTNLFNVSASSILNNAWHHVAVTRYAGTTRLFFDGVQVASAADTTNYNGAAGNFILGRDTNSADLAGYINDYRITKGIARYTSNFTPPTTAFLTL